MIDFYTRSVTKLEGVNSAVGDAIQSAISILSGLGI